MDRDRNNDSIKCIHNSSDHAHTRPALSQITVRGEGKMGHPFLYRKCQGQVKAFGVGQYEIEINGGKVSNDSMKEIARMTTQSEFYG